MLDDFHKYDVIFLRLGKNNNQMLVGVLIIIDNLRLYLSFSL